MNQIVLKTGLFIGEEVLYKGEKLIYKGRKYDSDYHFRMLFEAPDKTQMIAYPWQLDIIESPDEQAQVANAGKEIEEKPALKLRVGGVYRNRKGEIRKIVGLDNDMDYYRYKDDEGNLHYQDGIAGLNPPYDQDLIEEVQPEQSCDCKNHYHQVCDKCCMPGDGSDNRYLFHAEKEAVEYCGCNTANQAQLYAISREKHPIKCMRCFKPINGNQKPEGNPFKVGENVTVYDGCMSHSGTITYVEYDLLEIDGVRPWVHYKQCERVNDS